MKEIKHSWVCFLGLKHCTLSLFMHSGGDKFTAEVKHG